ncbi:PREDICTED: geraniol 8-hydroxylase-like [Ipomoea nil]|uniref:geraniol 8-hydroxylase-like n=1 Tax=Ipomoea nil TaxID=35883 RepID=UPI000900C700|nr:PREDICTED: geraniol 8-hydroxylase-like [Ipomoea nil]
MDYVTILVGLLFAWTLLRWLYNKITASSLPPGPNPLPIIGNLHQLGAQPHKSLAKLAATYGPIMSLKFGQITTIVVTSPDAAKQVLKNQDSAFASRPVPDATRPHEFHKFSVIWLPVGSRWRTFRKILNAGVFSNSRLDGNRESRASKVRDLVNLCRKSSAEGKAVDIGQAAFTTSLNLLSNTVFSKDLADPNSNERLEMRDLICEAMSESGKTNLVDFFPVLRKFDPQGVRRRITVCFAKLLQIFGGLIEERMAARALGTNDNCDMLDYLLNISNENPEIDTKQITFTILDLIGAGTDTSTSTVEWAMAETLKNPEVLSKVQTELKQVVGKGKQVDEADIVNLPYLQSIVKETLRMHPPVPFLVPRRVEQDSEVLGYVVPKGSQVLVNVWAIGRDSGIWKDPLMFEPERFMDAKVDVRGQDFELIPFGAGRRVCPGMPLAMRMVPVMLGSLLNSFDWQLESGIAPMDLDMGEKFSFTLAKGQPLRAVPISL